LFGVRFAGQRTGRLGATHFLASGEAPAHRWLQVARLPRTVARRARHLQIAARGRAFPPQKTRCARPAAVVLPSGAMLRPSARSAQRYAAGSRATFRIVNGSLPWRICRTCSRVMPC